MKYSNLTKVEKVRLAICEFLSKTVWDGIYLTYADDKNLCLYINEDLRDSGSFEDLPIETLPDTYEEMLEYFTDNLNNLLYRYRQVNR